jgi:L-lactate dehydrogenase (cytochrome)
VPRAIFDYPDRGSYDELTLTRNRTDLQAIEFRQRVMRDLSRLSVASTMVAQPVTMPLGIAPTGLTGLFYGDGEIHGALAALTFGIPFTLSTLSICSIEDVHAAVKVPFWFQVYLLRDRGFNQELIACARAAHCSALVLTVDLQVQGLRRRAARQVGEPLGVCAILRRVHAAGLMLECVSQGEIEHCFANVPGLAPEQVLQSASA